MLKKILDYFKKPVNHSDASVDLNCSSSFSHCDDEVEMTYHGVTFMAPEPISNEEYQRKRQANNAWLEAHYNLNTAEGIQSIPDRNNLPRPPGSESDGFGDYTCDIDYYLRFKSDLFEDAGNIELAILCLKKSNAIRMVSKRGYRKDDYYKLVRLLARSGLIKEAHKEKEKIDRFFQGYTNDSLIGVGPRLTAEEKRKEDSIIEREAQRGIDKRDYKWLQENLPDICPKSYSGYKRMKNNNTKNYQKLVACAKELGREIL